MKLNAKLFLPILIVLLATVANGQSECPTIEVTGPPGIIEPGEVMELFGSVNQSDSDGLTYQWHIIGGELISGQGTLTPRVKPEGVWSIQMTATLEVQGLPEGCPTTSSETFAQACKCEAILFDEFSISPNRIDKRRLDALVDSLGKYPDSKLHIIEYFRARTTRTVALRKVELVRRYLVDVRRLRPSDFEIVTDVSPEDSATTKLFVVPPGADKPTP